MPTQCWAQKSILCLFLCSDKDLPSYFQPFKSTLNRISGTSQHIVEDQLFIALGITVHYAIAQSGWAGSPINITCILSYPGSISL